MSRIHLTSKHGLRKRTASPEENQANIFHASRLA